MAGKLKVLRRADDCRCQVLVLLDMGGIELLYKYCEYCQSGMHRSYVTLYRCIGR